LRKVGAGPATAVAQLVEISQKPEAKLVGELDPTNHEKSNHRTTAFNNKKARISEKTLIT